MQSILGLASAPGASVGSFIAGARVNEPLSGFVWLLVQLTFSLNLYGRNWVAVRQAAVSGVFAWERSVRAGAVGESSRMISADR